MHNLIDRQIPIKLFAFLALSRGSKPADNHLCIRTFYEASPGFSAGIPPPPIRLARAWRSPRGGDLPGSHFQGRKPNGMGLNFAAFEQVLSLFGKAIAPIKCNNLDYHAQSLTLLFCQQAPSLVTGDISAWACRESPPFQ